MSDSLPDGVYEDLLTRRLRRAVAALHLRGISERRVSDDEAPQLLARAVGAEVQRVLEEIRGEEAGPERVALCNDLLGRLFSRVPSARADGVPEEGFDSPVHLLEAVYSTPAAPPRPATPLGRTSLLTGARRDPRFGAELIAEIPTANRVDAIVAFVTWRGWQQLRETLETFAAAHRSFRLLTTVYMGASDPAALEALARLPGVEVRISYDTRRTRLHAKAWLFHRETGLSTAYVGSANLSAAALGDGLEWTVKLSEKSDPDTIEKFRGEFETLWANAEFERLHPDDALGQKRLREALGAASDRGETPKFFFDLRPYPFQEEILEDLRREREEHGRHRNLVVAATGTGKTIVAAFDYRRFAEAAGGRPRLLFVAHREEILEQARFAFRNVLRDGSFGDRLGGGNEPSSFDHLFASLQSFNSRGLLARQGADYWDYVVVDEIHRGAADSYQPLLDHLRPRVLLGLTATPERTDQRDILHWFGGRPAAEIRLWDALDKRLLAPFDYFGIADGTDLTTVGWSRKGYDVDGLTNLYTSNDLRVRTILNEFGEKHGNPRTARALGFCVSVAHADYMARKFNEAGIPALSVHAGVPDDVRVSAPALLVSREVNVLFTCDLYNEGVDIPDVDTLLLLRPTESALLFQQQLGRGLRLAPGKSSVLVLDFIGQHRREFRFEERLWVLTGLTRRRLVEDVERGFPLLPPGCSLRLDKKSRSLVLENLRSALATNVAGLRADLLRCPGGAETTLRQFLDESRRPVDDVYAKAVGGWTALRRRAGFLAESAPPGEALLNARMERLLHVSDRLRQETWQRFWRTASDDGGPASPNDDLLLAMLAGLLWDYDSRPRSRPAVLGALAANAELAREFEQLAEIVTATRPHGTSIRPEAAWPLLLHHSYTSDEILAGTGDSTLEAPRKLAGTGVRFLRDQNADLFFVTINKSEKLFSSSTRYADYAVSPTEFHWQSQSTTPEDSPTGRRYREGHAHGHRAFLFVRENRDTDLGTTAPFVFLGPARYLRHHGSRPMSITWRLDHAIPPRYVDPLSSFRAA